MWLNNQKEHKGVGKIAQLVKKLAHGPDQMSSVPGSHQVAEELQLVKSCPLTSTCIP